MQLLEAVGFTASTEAFCLAADVDLAPLNAALARLRRIADDKGHSGEAEFFPAPIDSSSSGGSRGSAGTSPLLVGDVRLLALCSPGARSQRDCSQAPTMVAASPLVDLQCHALRTASTAPV